jgi:hypothetical protein
LDQTEPSSTLKDLSGKKYSFQKLTQFLLGNNVLYASASNTDVILLRNTFVPSIDLNNPIWSIHSLSPPLKLIFAGSIPFKN